MPFLMPWYLPTLAAWPVTLALVCSGTTAKSHSFTLSFITIQMISRDSCDAGPGGKHVRSSEGQPDNFSQHLPRIHAYLEPEI